VYIYGIHAWRAAAAEADIRIDLARRTDRSIGELARTKIQTQRLVERE
jgi:hypothetical protein